MTLATLAPGASPCHIRGLRPKGAFLVPDPWSPPSCAPIPCLAPQPGLAPLCEPVPPSVPFAGPSPHNKPLNPHLADAGPCSGMHGLLSFSLLVIHQLGIPLETEPGKPPVLGKCWPLPWQPSCQVQACGRCVCRVSGPRDLQPVAEGKCCLWKHFFCPQTKACGQGLQGSKQVQRKQQAPFSPLSLAASHSASFCLTLDGRSPVSLWLAPLPHLLLLMWQLCRLLFFWPFSLQVPSFLPSRCLTSVPSFHTHCLSSGLLPKQRLPDTCP